ncbi:hypothetical protein ONE63_008440 [Megalurothrips usitatus]|uniref:Uncharacterized protein n=1 Tax=Megalurothrips usitatus TaxID=439358 RepID=A0AAV7XL60_9NEOP|nr:hypothetical protein ONE63_008440 [Megalurothrips usitatus]
MVIDVRFMRARLRALRDQIEEAQYRKFGCVVDVAELEQALLKRFIWDLRSSADEIRSEFHSLIDSIQADVRAKFVEYKRAIERNTERQNLLLVLVEERNRLMAVPFENLHEQDEAGADVEESPFEEDVSRLQAVVRALRARRDALLAEAVRLRQKGPLLPPLLRPGSSARAARPAAGPLTSAYHTVCVADQMPPPPKPWPPACITAIKNPMYLGGTPRRAAVLATPGSGTTRSLAARREAVREQLAAGQDDGEGQPGVRHPQPLQRRSASLDSITAPGFLRADMRDVPAIPSEEELLTAGTAPSEADGDEAEAEAAASEGSVEELYRRVSASDALGAVDGFLERLGSKDAEETLMLVEHRRESTDAEDAEPMTTDDADVSDADPAIDDITDDDSDDGMVQRPPSVPRQSGGSTDEDGPG